ncbi:hypothetical protein FNF28_03025 [Cafeteria roenbergensis]|uniref:Uncharacterized protein n=1 Tax=Cafeteria roenbergensis TaxID=33653 RepID=A0A5A8DQC6_CAFRO|nr:hypothetical protein FNF28_03025 [Cafeteria roenbergensis]
MLDVADPAASALLGWTQAERFWWGAVAAVFGPLSVTGAAVAADDAGQSGGGASASLMQRVADKLAGLEGRGAPSEPDWSEDNAFDDGFDDDADASGDDNEGGPGGAAPREPTFSSSSAPSAGVPGWSAVRREFGGRGRPEDFESAEDAGMALRRELVDRLGLSSGGAGLAAVASGTGHYEADAEVQAGWGVRKALAAVQSKTTGCTAEQAAEVALHKWRMCMEGADTLPWRLGKLTDRETGPFSLPLLQLRALRILGETR